MFHFRESVHQAELRETSSGTSWLVVRVAGDGVPRNVREKVHNSRRGCASAGAFRSIIAEPSLPPAAIMDLSDSLVNGGSAPADDTNASANPPDEGEIDPIWLSSRTARQIYGLCQVEKVREPGTS